MATTHNLRATSHQSFRIGKTGPTLYQDSTAPSSGTGIIGDIFIRGGSVPRLYQKVGTEWVQLSSTQQVVQSKAADYQTQLPDDVILVNSSAGPVTITLGNTTVKTGKSVVIKDVGGAASLNAITVVGQGGQLIDGEAQHIIGINRESITLISDGTDWFMI